MKITLPESIKDITLGQFQKFDVLCKRLEDEEINDVEFLKLKISLFSGIPYRQVDKVLRKDLEDVVEQVDKALSQDSKFVNRFTMEGIDFGFVDNLDNIIPTNQYGLTDEKGGAYFDMSSYGTEVESLHKLMAILFRPINMVKHKNSRVKKLFTNRKHTLIKDIDKYGNYKVEKYKGSTKYGELMKRMPLNIVNGSLVFFCNLSKELRIHTQKSTEAEQAKEEKRQLISSSGDGCQPSMN
jgi:hypothetical protein